MTKTKLTLLLRPLTLTVALSALQPVAAQTTVWSEAPKTKVWSEAPRTKVWSKNRNAPVSQFKSPGGKIDTHLVGTWNVWIPTGVRYETDGLRNYQRITPGAAANRLSIQGNGAYQWGANKGRLKEVRPYFAFEGQRYFEVSPDKRNKYLVRYNEKTKVLDLFFDVGGYYAKGTRVASSVSKNAKTTLTRKQRRR